MKTLRERFEHVAASMHEAEPGVGFVVNRKPSIRRLAQECGLSPATFNNFIAAIESGKEKSPDFSTAEQFERRTGFSWHWVLSGVGPEKNGQLKLLLDDSGEPQLQGVISIVRRFTDRVVESLKRQPEFSAYPERVVRQAVADALFLGGDIRSEADLGFAAQKILRSKSGEHQSARFRAVPALTTTGEFVATEPTDPRR